MVSNTALQQCNIYSRSIQQYSARINKSVIVNEERVPLLFVCTSFLQYILVVFLYLSYHSKLLASANDFCTFGHHFYIAFRCSISNPETTDICRTQNCKKGLKRTKQDQNGPKRTQKDPKGHKQSQSTAKGQNMT